MPPITDMPKGIDVSKFQRTVDWHKVKNAGMSFAFARAIDDKTGTKADPFFANNWTGMKDAGLFRGAYHFFRPKRDPVKAANLFASVVGLLGKGDLPPVIDVEDDDGVSVANILDGVKTWIDITEAALNRKVMIYTFTPFWRDTLGNSTRFSDHPLWVAHFTNAAQPRFPSAFPRFAFWQHSQSGTVPGVNGAVDLDRFNGSATELKTFAGF